MQTVLMLLSRQRKEYRKADTVEVPQGSTRLFLHSVEVYLRICSPFLLYGHLEKCWGDEPDQHVWKLQQNVPSHKKGRTRAPSMLATLTSTNACNINAPSSNILTTMPRELCTVLVAVETHGWVSTPKRKPSETEVHP